MGWECSLFGLRIIRVDCILVVPSVEIIYPEEYYLVTQRDYSI